MTSAALSKKFSSALFAKLQVWAHTSAVIVIYKHKKEAAATKATVSTYTVPTRFKKRYAFRTHGADSNISRGLRLSELVLFIVYT